MQLVWFRQDLRLVDHPALSRACRLARQRGEAVEAVFVISPAQWARHHMAPVRQAFLLARLDVLGAELARLGIRLHCLRVDWFVEIPTALQQLVQARGATALHALTASEHDERGRDADVQRALQIPCNFYAGDCVFAPGTLLTGKGEAYRVFTPFSRAWLKTLAQEGFSLLPIPQAVGAPLPWQPLALPAPSPGLAAMLAPWPVDEGAAEARLQAFVAEDLLAYPQCRDLPAVPGTARLSAYLAAGILSPNQCLAALLAQLGQLPLAQGAPGFAWLNELIWREFYRHLLVLLPRLSRDQPFNLATRQLAWRQDAADFAAWCQGQTGFPIVDAAMRCLKQTGWLHNRLRMVVASFLTKDLLISWRWGEDYFMSQLIDGDLAANNGGWQWAASTGADAAPYFRVFNPTTQGQRFDPDGDFIRRWLPELARVPGAHIHRPHAWLDAHGLAGIYPLPRVDHAQARLAAIALFKG
ncbi:deoxyribodipyrimidine photo-lyase [Pseudaeromonas sp. ZJS20]|uniref:deoxyribodipyrimidine photo-lyase n=1 Tax=Pseudaeromonas aegiceratis TaxID=3153928 RepID=UPI00390C49BA